MRFASAALDGEFRGPGYAQEDWVRLHGYSGMPWETIVDIWSRYNMLLVGLVANIPEERLGSSCFIGANPEVTLRFVIEDYVAHMQHHIDQMLRRTTVTRYSGAAMPS
jgi:hypothetical protein